VIMLGTTADPPLCVTAEKSRKPEVMNSTVSSPPLPPFPIHFPFASHLFVWLLLEIMAAPKWSQIIYSRLGFYFFFYFFKNKIDKTPQVGGSMIAPSNDSSFNEIFKVFIPLVAQISFICQRADDF
jgi:hypothetical protein